MAHEDLLRDLDALVGSQKINSFILTGIYVPHEWLAALRAVLEPDHPPVGATGRYKGVPIFPEGTLPDRLRPGVEKGVYRGRPFTFVPMLAVD